jgi:hypothetical protein
MVSEPCPGIRAIPPRDRERAQAGASPRPEPLRLRPGERIPLLGDGLRRWRVAAGPAQPRTQSPIHDEAAAPGSITEFAQFGDFAAHEPAKVGHPLRLGFGCCRTWCRAALIRDASRAVLAARRRRSASEEARLKR